MWRCRPPHPDINVRVKVIGRYTDQYSICGEKTFIAGWFMSAITQSAMLDSQCASIDFLCDCVSCLRVIDCKASGLICNPIVGVVRIIVLQRHKLIYFQKKTQKFRKQYYSYTIYLYCHNTYILKIIFFKIIKNFSFKISQLVLQNLMAKERL